jgi:homoserine kinase
MRSATAFAPGSIGNVGPGFDVLGLAVDGVGDRVTVTLRDVPGIVVEASGLDAEHLPLDDTRNTAAIAAAAVFARAGYDRGAMITIEKGLPLSGGLGGSAASSVAGAAAAHLALHDTLDLDAIVAAALAGESTVSGWHLDNILPSVFGGLMLARTVDPIDYVRLRVAEPWWLAVVTPAVRIETKRAREILPENVERQLWIQLMANTASMVHAFAAGDGPLLRRALDDVYAERARKALIPHFDNVKRAALSAGSIGCSISGSGPTVFAIAPDELTAKRCGDAMQRSFAELRSVAHIAPIAAQGVRAV